jgi:ribosomal protein L11 methyltransferase
MAGYLELSFDLDGLDPDTVESVCRALGSLAVTLSDAGETPVLEPRPGEVRLWSRTRVQALFDAASADASLLLQLATRLGIEPTGLAARAVAERVWEREWLRDFHAMRFGERLWICPHHERVDMADAVVLKLDPGLAFGTGTHASTALCLQWLDAAARARPGGLQGYEVIDYGCGSGVLGLAAALLGAARVHAYDIDPQALLATRENAAANGLADRIHLCERAAQLPGGCQLLLANILGSVLKDLRAEFAQLLPAGARLVLAGLLVEEAEEMASAFAKWFDMRQFAQREGWVALSGTRY